MTHKQRATSDPGRSYVDDTAPRKQHRNPLIAAMQATHPQWRDPPNEDARLVWRWNVADAECGERSGGWPSGPKNMKEHPAFDESNSAQAKAVGNMDRYSPAARRRETDGHLAALAPFDVVVLKRAYGPEERSGPNAVHAQTKARLGTLARARIALLTPTAIAGACSTDERVIERWLRHEAGADEVEAVKEGADALLFGAHNRYCDVRGRRKRPPMHASEAAMLESLDQKR